MCFFGSAHQNYHKAANFFLFFIFYFKGFLCPDPLPDLLGPKGWHFLVSETAANRAASLTSSPTDPSRFGSRVNVVPTPASPARTLTGHLWAPPCHRTAHYRLHVRLFYGPQLCILYNYDGIFISVSLIVMSVCWFAFKRDRKKGCEASAKDPSLLDDSRKSTVRKSTPIFCFCSTFFGEKRTRRCSPLAACAKTNFPYRRNHWNELIWFEHLLNNTLFKQRIKGFVCEATTAAAAASVTMKKSAISARDTTSGHFASHFSTRTNPQLALSRL